jgi:hypothetical protein
MDKKYGLVDQDIVAKNKQCYQSLKSDPKWFNEYKGYFIVIAGGIWLEGKFKSRDEGREKLYRTFDAIGRAIPYYIVCVGDEYRDTAGFGPGPRPTILKSQDTLRTMLDKEL